MTSCAGTDARLQDAARTLGAVRAEQQAGLPPYPSDCRVIISPDIREGDRLDVVVLRYDQVLDEQNARIARCARWYDTLRDGRSHAAP